MSQVENQLGRHWVARDLAAQDQSEWAWRLLLAIGVANGTGLITAGSMLGAAAFADRAVRGLALPSFIFTLGMILYGVGVLASWFVSRATADRHQTMAQGLLQTHVRVEGAVVRKASAGDKGAELAERAKGFGDLAVTARLVAWAITAASALVWLVGISTMAWAVFSGALKHPAAADQRPIVNVQVPPAVVIQQFAPPPDRDQSSHHFRKPGR